MANNGLKDNVRHVEYTHTRISKPYLIKLNKLATKNKRSAAKQLEVLIDKELGK